MSNLVEYAVNGCQLTIGHKLNACMAWELMGSSYGLVKMAVCYERDVLFQSLAGDLI
jgi:hypothetical protein